MKEVDISTRVNYEVQRSVPIDGKYLFKYHITIKNNSKDSVQLLSRTWIIFDFSFGITMVHGQGVIGIQPVLEPEEEFTYFSFCELKSPIGTMRGNYDMIHLDSQAPFTVNIPRFTLFADLIKN